MGKAYIGINTNPMGYNPIAKKISKIYIGDGNGIAKEIKKGYVSVDGIAKLFWDITENEYDATVQYIGTVGQLAEARNEIFAESIGDHLLFAGGYVGTYASDSNYRNTVEAFDSDLTKSTLTDLNSARSGATTGTIGNYALLAGGSNYSTYFDTVDAFNINLTKSTASSLHTILTHAGSVNAGDYLLISGGTRNYSVYSQTEAYSRDLTKTTCTNLQQARKIHAGGSIGEYGLFLGGSTSYMNTSPTNSVESYDTNLVRGDVSSMSVTRLRMHAVTMEKYLIVAGGDSTGGWVATDVIDVYDKNLVRNTATSLSSRRHNCASVYAKGKAIIPHVKKDTETLYTDIFDDDLVRTTVEALSVGMSVTFAGGMVGNYALFSGKTQVVDAYKIS